MMFGTKVRHGDSARGFGTKVRHEGSARWFGMMVLVAAMGTACSSKPAEEPVAATKKPADSQHAGITTPHGDHTPHHGGIVMMHGDMHYEVVFDPAGRHRVWFSDAVREELPASVATGVTMVIGRPMGPAEPLVLTIDESGESWVAAGAPLDEVGTMVKLTFSVRGEPFEIEIPYVKS